MESKDELDYLRKLFQRLLEIERGCKELEDILEKGLKRKNPWDNLSEKEKKEYVSLLLKV